MMKIKEKTARDWDPRTREQTARDWDPRTQDDAETKAAAATAVAMDTEARATFEGQSSDRIAKSDVVKDTMSATLKLAKEIDEPDIRQSTADCHLMAWSEKRRRVTRRDEH